MKPRHLAVVAALTLTALVAWFLRGAEPLPPTPRASIRPLAPTAVRPSPLVVATPVDAPPAPTPPPSDVAARTPRVVLRGRWGAQPGEFGHSAQTEGNPEGPMALTVMPDGAVVVLDTQNRRAQRFVDGRYVSSFALASGAVQDVTHTADGRVVSLDRLATATITLHDTEGATRATVGVVGGPITEGGAVTGVFADTQGVYVEREHREVVRVLDEAGREDRARSTLWGRPTRDGRQLLRASIDDRARGVVRVSVAARENGAMDWSTAVPLGAPVVQLVMLDSDAAGRIYLAAETGTPTPDGIRDASILAFRFDTTGTVARTLRIPAPTGAEELFRPMCVDDGGAVYVMVTTSAGVEVHRYVFDP